jgi:hypothetical protein
MLAQYGMRGPASTLPESTLPESWCPASGGIASSIPASPEPPESVGGAASLVASAMGPPSKGAPLQRVSGGEHVSPHLLSEQTSPSGHGFLHPPQFALSV